MRNTLFFLFFAVSALAQNSNSAAERQVDSLLKASRNFSGKGDFDKAFEIIADAEKIALSPELGLGRMTEAYARCCFDRGRVLYMKGDWAASEKRHREALSIREKVLGREHFNHVVSLNNVAFMNEKLGNYEKAEPLYLEAIAILEKTVGKEHFAYAKCLNSLAILYQQMGIYEKAEQIQLEVKAIREKTVGKEHLDYAVTLNNLANVYWSNGDYEKAEPLLLEAAAITEKVLGKEHLDYGKMLDGLAVVYHQTGRYEKAEQAYLEATTIVEKALGKEHTDYGTSQNNLAAFYIDIGNYEKAELHVLEGDAVWTKTLGPEHPYRALSLENQAILYASMGNVVKAEPLLAELSKLNQTLTTRALHHLSEREMDSYLKKFSASQNRALSFVQTSKNSRTAQTCFDNSLFYKGFLLNAAGQLRNLAFSDTATTDKFERLKSVQRRLAVQLAQPIAARAGVEALETEANDLEKDLARTVAGYGEAMRQVKWQDVQRALRPGEAAVEFVHYRFYRTSNSSDSTMYAALVLLPGAEQPKFIPLFEEKTLDLLLKSSGGQRKSEYVNRVYAPQNAGGKTLYQIVWQPMEKELAGVKKVWFAPSGLLHRLNLSAIPVSENEVLADRLQFTELGSTRQLVANQAISSISDNIEAVLFGGIQFDFDSTFVANADADLATRSQQRTGGEFDFSQTDAASRGGNWTYLKWTEKEVEAIRPILAAAGMKVGVFKSLATEQVFKSLSISNNKYQQNRPVNRTRSPRILHVATHGYFFPDATPQPPKGGATANSPFRGLGGDPVFKTSDHPMIRSGLLLAGGNYAWKTGKPLHPGMEDGILTAYEISQMDLSNTELVVLSACETGLGDIAGNEGVYGLQRAFKIAGVKNLIMSLWQVPDFQTQEMMTAFYQNWLGGVVGGGANNGMPLPEAFRAAQKMMREKYQHPYFWAGFVLVE